MRNLLQPMAFNSTLDVHQPRFIHLQTKAERALNGMFDHYLCCRQHLSLCQCTQILLLVRDVLIAGRCFLRYSSTECSPHWFLYFLFCTAVFQHTTVVGWRLCFSQNVIAYKKYELVSCEKNIFCFNNATASMTFNMLTTDVELQ